MLTLYYPEWDKLELRELSRPAPSRNEVLIRVSACGVCGSELETFRGRSARRTPPLVMGHEFCGHVVEVGPEVEEVFVGDRVVCNAVVGCGVCDHCQGGNDYLCDSRQVFGMHRQGAFAEYVSAPSRAIIDWPESLSAAEACLAEPLGNGIHVFRATQRLDHQNVVVLGAGAIGLFCQQVFQILGGSKVVVSDPLEPRRLFASQLGAVGVIDPTLNDVVDGVRQMFGGSLPDLVVDAVGSQQTKKQSLALAKTGGTVVWIGLHQNTVEIDSYDITLSELSIIGTYGASRDDMTLAIQLMQDGRVDAATWTTSYSLEESVVGFRSLIGGVSKNIKVVIQPTLD